MYSSLSNKYSYCGRGEYDFTLGERYLAIPREFIDLLEAQLQHPAINVKPHDAHKKVSNHFNDIRKLSMKIQRVRNTSGIYFIPG